MVENVQNRHLLVKNSCASVLTLSGQLLHNKHSMLNAESANILISCTINAIIILEC